MFPGGAVCFWRAPPPPTPAPGARSLSCQQPAPRHSQCVKPETNSLALCWRRQTPGLYQGSLGLGPAGTRAWEEKRVQRSRAVRSATLQPGPTAPRLALWGLTHAAAGPSPSGHGNVSSTTGEQSCSGTSIHSPSAVLGVCGITSSFFTVSGNRLLASGSPLPTRFGSVVPTLTSAAETKLMGVCQYFQRAGWGGRVPLRPAVYTPQLWIIREKVAMNWKWGRRRSDSIKVENLNFL